MVFVFFSKFFFATVSFFLCGQSLNFLPIFTYFFFGQSAFFDIIILKFYIFFFKIQNLLSPCLNYLKIIFNYKVSITHSLIFLYFGVIYSIWGGVRLLIL